MTFFNVNSTSQKHTLLENTHNLPGSLNNLHHKILENIGDYLNLKNFQQLLSLKHSWTNKIVDITINKEKSLQNFINFLGPQINEMTEKQAEIKTNHSLSLSGTEPFRLEDESISKSMKGKQIKSEFLGIKKMLIKALKKLDKKDLEDLENLSKDHEGPSFFEDLFELAKFYKEIDQVDFEDRDHLDNIVTKLALVDLEETLNFILKIPNDLRMCALFSKILNKLSMIDEVMDVFQKLSYSEAKKNLLWTMFDRLIPVNISKAMELAERITEPKEKPHPFWTISYSLIEIDVDKAINYAERIPDIGYQADAFYRICHFLIRNDINRAIKIAEGMPDSSEYSQSVKSTALEKITNEIILKDLDKAKSVAEKIPDPQRQATALENIARKFILIDVKKAYDTINSISNPEAKKLPHERITMLLQRAGSALNFLS